MRDQLFELFDYDLWANLEWLNAIPSLPYPDRAMDVVAHILRAQHIWIIRCLSEESNTPFGTDLENEAVRLNAAWKDLIRVADLNAYIAYNNLAGESHMNLLSDIAFHVANHGTYHRGHLRGLCEATGTANFPETDLILYARLKP